MAGLVAGITVTIAAVSDGARPGGDGPVIAAASASPTSPPPTAALAAWTVGSLQRQEADHKRAFDVAMRRQSIAAASRSNARPSLVWPAAGGLSGWFGEGRGSHRHVGVDVDGETGDAIVASGAGVVEWAGRAPDGYAGYGLMVMIRHSSAVETLYAHLSRINVQPGDVVEAGDYIGAMGTTGNVTGSHLHFEVRLGGAPVNPRDWLPDR